MTQEQFYEKFRNMEPMKYYEASLDHPKAKEMIENKDNQYFAMRKYDGEWCRAIIMEDGVLLQSRSVSKVTGTYGDKTELVPHIVESLRNSFPAGTVLLGELAFDDFESTSREVGSILRCKAPKAIERQKENKLHYFVFDILAYAYEDKTEMNFSERYKLVPGFLGNKYIKIPANTNSDFMEFADSVWAKGGEGIMIIPNDAKYQPGKRTAWRSLKVKKKMGDLELDVVSFIEPNKEYSGSEINNWPFWVDENDKRMSASDFFNMRDLGKVQPVTKPYYYGWKNGVVVNHNGNLVRVTSGLTDLDRDFLSTEKARELLLNNKLKATITGMEITPDSIRHPVFKKLNY